MAKDADIKMEMSQSGEALQSEKPYIPETAAGDTSKNVLDGNGSAAFKTAHFASSGGSSAAYEQSKGGQSSGATTSGNERGSSVKVAKSHGKVEELESKMFATTASGKAENKTVAKAESGKKTAKNDNKGDGSTTETGKETSFETQASAENKGETAKASNGETEPETGNVVTPMTINVEDTISTVAASRKEERPEWESEKENARRKELEALKAKKEKERRMREEKRNGLRQHFLQVLKNAFEKEADCDVDDVVSPSDRQRGGITSNDVMRLAAFPSMRIKCVTLYIDTYVTSSDLILLLTELGAKAESERNPNVSFLLPNDTRFLDESTSIRGVVLTAGNAAMRITFPKTTPSASSKKKADEKKTSDAKGETTGTSSGDLTSMTKPGATAVETPDFLGTLWQNAEKEAEIRKQIRENIHSLTPLMQRKGSFDGGTNFSLPPLLPLHTADSRGAAPQGTSLNSPRNSTPPSCIRHDGAASRGSSRTSSTG